MIFFTWGKLGLGKSKFKLGASWTMFNLPYKSDSTNYLIRRPLQKSGGGVRVSTIYDRKIKPSNI